MLAPAERYTTIGVRSGKTRTMVFFLYDAELFSSQKRRETLLSLLWISAKEGRRKWLGFLGFVSQNATGKTQHLCRISLALKSYFLLHL